MQTNNCFMSSGYCFQGCWAGSILGIPLDTAGGCSCQQLLRQTAAWSTTARPWESPKEQKAAVPKQVVFSWPSAPMFYLQHTSVVQSVIFCCTAISITSGFGTYFAPLNQIVGGTAQETDLPERAWMLTDGLAFKSMESSDFLGWKGL